MAPRLTLYGYYKSSCTTRLRIALALKQIDYTPVYVNFFEKEHRSAAYTALNPNQALPTLQVTDDTATGSGGSEATPVYITQSVAALEFLEETFRDSAMALMPPVSDAAGRAVVRSLVGTIVADLQPRQAAQTLERLTAQFGADTPARTKWAHDWCVKELGAYEGLIAGIAGQYSVGDAPTLADVCLVPAVQNAEERWGVDIAQFPTLARVYANLKALPAVQTSHWSQQPDAPKP